LGFRPCNLKFIWFWTFMKNFNPCNLWKFQFIPCNLSKFQFTPLLIWSNFGLPTAISSILYSQNPWKSKTKKLQITRTKSKKKILQGEKPKMTYITGGKTLLTLKFISSYSHGLFLFLLGNVINIKDVLQWGVAHDSWFGLRCIN